MWKRLFSYLIFLGTFAVGVVVGLGLALPDRSLLEVLEEGFGPWIDRPQTEFAPSLREEAFRALPLGITESQTLAALGPPLGSRACSDRAVCWDYSAPGASGASYFPRVLVFDASGHLIERYMGFVLND
jgi:hypothetical protein